MKGRMGYTGDRMYSGTLNERDMLGEFKASPQAIARLREIASDRGYVSYNKAMDFARQFSEKDPTDPEKPFANQLRSALIEELDLETDEEMDRLKFYSAVGTPLDVFHGVDAWIEYVSPSGARVVVTIDVTLNTNKSSHKADVIVQEIPNMMEDKDKFLDEIYDKYAPMVAEYLREAVVLDKSQRKAV